MTAVWCRIHLRAYDHAHVEVTTSGSDVWLEVVGITGARILPEEARSLARALEEAANAVAPRPVDQWVRATNDEEVWR